MPHLKSPSYGYQPKARIIHIRALKPLGTNGSHQWKVSVSCGTYHAIVTLTDPFTPSQEARLRWALEEHPSHHPFETHKSRAISEELQTYSISLVNQLNLHEVLKYQYQEALENKRSLGAWNRARQSTEAITQYAKARKWYLDIEGSRDGITDGMVQGLHWEVLENPGIWPSSMKPCLIVRRKVPSNDVLTRGSIIAIRSDTFRILLVVGHSLHQAQAGGGTVANPGRVSRPLAEIIQQLTKEVGGNTSRIQLEIVRPGTWKSLGDHLKRRGKGYFHLVHLDVRGKAVHDKARKLDLVSLAFVSDHPLKKWSWQYATDVSTLLSAYGVRLVVLNVPRTSQAFGACETNVAETLILDGIRAVIALPYKVLDTGTDLLMSTFYECFLSEDWDFAIALSEARKSMMKVQLREGRFGIKVPVEDWIIPTLYHSGGTEVSVVASDDISGDLTSIRCKGMFSKFQGLLQLGAPDPTLLTVGTTSREPGQSRFRGIMSQRGMIGRDGDIFKMEMMLDTPILRVLGPPGIGKSTLVTHLASWWKVTSLVKDCFFFDWYENPQLNIEMITRQLYLSVFPPGIDGGGGHKEARSHLPMHKMFLRHLSQPRSPPPNTEIFPNDWVKRTLTELRETPYLIVLDSLESSDASTGHNERLKGEINELLECLQEGRTVVLIVSNRQECWLNNKFRTYHLDKLEMAHGIELAEMVIKQYGCDRKPPRGTENRQYLQLLVKLSDMNPLVMNLTLRNIAIYDDSPKTTFLSLVQGRAIHLKPGSESTKAMRNIANLLGCLDADSQQLLLCLTPFWTRLPKSIGFYIQSLLYRRALPGTADPAKNSETSRKPSKLGKQCAKSITFPAGLLIRYKYIIQDLLSLSLLTDNDMTDASNPSPKSPSQYYHVHPLLTLSLRQTVAKEQASSNLKIIDNHIPMTSAFLDYYTHRSTQWAKHPDETYESAAQELRDEGINFLSAISIPLQHDPDKVFEIFPIHAYSRFASMSLVDKDLSPNAPLMAHVGKLILQHFDALRSQRGNNTLGEAVVIALFTSNWLCEYHSEKSTLSSFIKQIEKSLELMKFANTHSPNFQERLATLEEQATKQKSAAVSGGMIEGLQLRKPWNGLIINDVCRQTATRSRGKRGSDRVWLSLAATFSRLHSVAIQVPLVARFSLALSRHLKKDLKIIWDDCVNLATGTDLELFLPSYGWVAKSLETPPQNKTKDELPADKRISSSFFLGLPEFIRSQIMLQLRDRTSAKRYLLDGLQRARNKSDHSGQILTHICLCDITFELQSWNDCITHAEYIRHTMAQLGEDVSTDDFKAFAQATWRKGVCHNNLRQWEAAVEAFNEALGVCRHVNDGITEYSILRKLAAIKRGSGLGEMNVVDALLKALAIAYNPSLARKFAAVGEHGVLLRRIISAMDGKTGENRERVIARMARSRETSEQEMHEFINDLIAREKEILGSDGKMGIPLHKTRGNLTRLHAEAERIIFGSPEAMSQQPLEVFAGSRWEKGLLSRKDHLLVAREVAV